jgi:hypothetical protein
MGVHLRVLDLSGPPLSPLKISNSEDGIFDLLADENILDISASEEQAMNGWYTVSAEQLAHLEVLVPLKGGNSCARNELGS